MRGVLLILASFFSVSAVAGIYKCTNSSGKTEYRSSPCLTGHENVEIDIKTGTATNLDEQNQQQRKQQNLQKAEQEKLKLEQAEALKKQANINKAAIIESAKNQFLIKNNPEKFSAYAIPPYAPDKLPELVKSFQDRLDEIERLRRLAAEKALATNECTRVESVELHTNSTKDSLLFFVNCSSAKSFYFKSQDLVK